MEVYNFLVFIFILLCIYCAVDAKQHIKIGGIFDREDNDAEQLAFEYTVDSINAERLLPRHRLVALSARVAMDDNFAVNQAVCKMLQEGAMGIFGTSTIDTSYHVQSICDSKDVPHMETRMDSIQGRGTLINVHPHSSALGKLFVNLVQVWGWKSFTILYENNFSFPRLSDLLKMYNSTGYTITMRQLDLGIGNNNYRPILHRVKKSGETNFILDCSLEILPEVLLQAQQVGIMFDHHSYIITNPDMHTVNLEPFQHGGANITGIRFVNTDDPNVMELLEEWSQRFNQRPQSPDQETVEDPFTAEKLKSSSALIHDAVRVFVHGLKSLNASSLQPRQLSCDLDDSWGHGTTMINYMKTNTLQGLTKEIKFDNQGHRTDVEVDIIELASSGLDKVGTWSSGGSFNLTRNNNVILFPTPEDSLVNKTFIVLTALSPPYGMYREASKKLSGNERFEGFGIELIHELSKMLGFNYTFVLQHDKKYGEINNVTKEWNGMVRQLLDGKVDLAITDLTITADRENAVDFTMPFMNLGISILYTKPVKEPPDLFSFMSPFSKGVWLCLGIAYITASIILFISGRISPKEWTNPYPCIEEPEQLRNQFSMANSLWFMVGAVLQQGSEIAPIAISTRMIAGVWWFFTLIMVSSYTANLAAFLTVESPYSPFNSASELVANKEGITYGAKAGGSTHNFFKFSDDETFKAMGNFMNDHPSAMTDSNEDGENRVLRGRYAYLMESTSIEYITERKCDLTMVGGLLDDKGYGIAMRKNSPYRNKLSTSVLQLQQSGKLTAMKKKWWTEKRGGGACQGGGASDASAVSLTMDNVGGVFVVLIAAGVLAVLIAANQMIWDGWSVAKKQKAVKEKDGNADLDMSNVGGVFAVLFVGCVISCMAALSEMWTGIKDRAIGLQIPFRQELMAEIKFVMKCSGETKPVRHRRSASGSENSNVSGEEFELGRSKETVGEPELENGRRKTK